MKNLRTSILSLGLAALTLGACASQDEIESPDGPIAGVANGGMLPAGQTAEERIGKADGYDPRDAYPERYGFTPAPAVEVVLPGEFEPANQLLIGWSQGADQHSDFFTSIAANASHELPVTIYVGSQSEASDVYSNLAYAGANLDAVSFAGANLDSIWMRDYGPLVVRAETGGSIVVDGRYYWGRWNDDYLPTVYANDQHETVVRPPIDIEGGNLLSDGKGACVSTEALIGRQSSYGYEENDVRDILRNYYGCEQTVFVPSMLGEGTGHVDMHVHLTGPKKAIVGRYTSAQDSVNAQRLDTTASRLSAAGFTVSRIPMPDNDGRSVFRSYTNGLAVNDRVLVPVYDEDNRFEAEALDVYEAAYPGRTIVPIDSDEIIYWAGAIHCVTMTVAP